MKWLRSFVGISLVLISILSVFSLPQKVSAETFDECMAAAGRSDAKMTKCQEAKAFNECMVAAGKSDAKATQCQEAKALADCLTAAGDNQLQKTACTASASTLPGDATPPATPPKADTPTDASKCTINWKDGVNIGGCLDVFFAWIITHTLLAFAGWFLWISATLMNYSMSVGILRFGEWAPDSLYPIWIVVRQIVSLFVVFAGLWLGFMYIINKGEEFKKYIPWVVIFALFVNFSYPLTRTLVDVSNIISLKIYSSTIPGALTAGPEDNQTAGAMIRDRLGLQGLIDFAVSDPNKVTGGAEGALNRINSTPGALLAVIFVGYAAYIFFKITILIIARTAVLIFLIIASPLLFVDSVIPKLGEKAMELRKMFFEQLAVGPIFAIMLALTLKFLDVFQVATKAGDSGGVMQAASASGAGAVATFFNLFMMLVMLHIMYKVTKAVSGSVGEAATKAVGKVGSFALGAAAGGVGMLGRAGIGRAAAKFRDSSWMTGMQDKKGVGGFVGKQLFNASHSVATSSFDGRNSAFVRTNAEKLGMRLGTGNAMGFEEREEKDFKDRQMRRNFAKNKLKGKENMISEEYHSIDDIAAKKAFLNANVKDVTLRNKLEEEDAKKIMSKYKEFDDSKQGKAAKDAFYDKQTDTMKERINEHDEKKRDERFEKEDDKKAREAYQKEALEIAKRTADAQEKIANHMGGGNPVLTASQQSLESQARARGAVQNVAVPLPTNGGVDIGQAIYNSKAANDPNFAVAAAAARTNQPAVNNNATPLPATVNHVDINLADAFQ